MYETHVTAVGRVVTPVSERRFADGTAKVSFRVACNERRIDRTTGAWVDGDTLYLSVTCRRTLAENVYASLVVGDPVVVRGRIFSRQYDKDGRRVSVMELEASAVGPDLTRCRAAITRTKRAGGSGETGSGAEDSVSTATDRVPEQTDDPWRSGPLIDVAENGSLTGEQAARREDADGTAATQHVVEAGVGA